MFVHSRRKTTQPKQPGTDVTPLSVRNTLRTPGQPLDAQTRKKMESRFGHDFSGVRIHADEQAAESASVVNAHAYTVGRDVVFGVGQYAPYSENGQRLIAHELTHVVQQGNKAATPGGRTLAGEHEARAAAERVSHGEFVSPAAHVQAGAIQCEGEEDEEKLRLPEPELGQSLGYRPRQSLIDVPQLQLDPQIAIQMRALQYVNEQLAFENLMARLRRGVNLTPTAPQRPAGGLDMPTPQAPAPLVPQPSLGTYQQPTPARPGTGGDVWNAVSRVPMFQQALTGVKDDALRQLRSLSPGEIALGIGQGVLMSSIVITGMVQSPEMRQTILPLVGHVPIPVPGLPMTLRIDPAGPDYRFMMNLDVGALLPRQLGFKGK